MSKFKILLTDRQWAGLDIEKSVWSDLDAIIVEPESRDPTELEELAIDVDAIATCWAPLSEKLVRDARQCQIIARYGVGLDNIPVQTAHECGITVTYLPDYCTDDVADHTLSLILAAVRQLTFFDRQMKQGEYYSQPPIPLKRFQELTLGVIGLGRIGRALVERARVLGFNIIAAVNRPQQNPPCSVVPLDGLLASADVVSLLCPLNADTYHLIGSRELNLMKRSAILVNTSRGPLVDPEALLHALETGQIAYAALDVFEPEPPDLSESLYQSDRVLLTPHRAFYSEASMAELRTRVARQVRDLLQGRKPEYLVLPD